MINVTTADIDTACAAYGRATGDYPRREGIRSALHSYRQMDALQREAVNTALIVLRIEAPRTAKAIEQLLGLES